MSSPAKPANKPNGSAKMQKKRQAKTKPRILNGRAMAKMVTFNKTAMILRAIQAKKNNTNKPISSIVPPGVKVLFCYAF